MPKKNKVSIDEVLNDRKDFANDDGILYKAIASPKSWDGEKRSARFIMSAETEDRHGDVVVQSGINLKNFKKNPVAFYNHNSWGTPIGSWGDIDKVKGSTPQTEGTIKFCDEGVDDMADKVARHVEGGTIKAASIGFMPKKMERIRDDADNWVGGYKFNEIELFECSVVSVPAVREALVKGNGNIKDILSPVVVEEFLEHLKSNPAILQLVDKELFEEAYREATGNKKSVDTVGLDFEIGVKGMGEFEKLIDRAEKTAIALEKLGLDVGEIEKSEPDPIAKEIKDGVGEVVEKMSSKIDEVDDDERKGVLSGMLDAVKSVFGKEPELASEEEKTALKDKLKELELDAA